MANAIFKNLILHEKFNVNGYLMLKMSDSNIIKNLEEIYHSHHQSNDQSYLYASNHMNDYSFNRNLDEDVRTCLSYLLDENFYDFRYLTGHFMVKPPRNDNEFQLHQDWSITDEQHYSVAHLWIPLQDTGPENGGMFVVEGSHRFFKNRRSGSLDIPRLRRDRLINKMIKPLHVRKGQMLVYHPALFHGSFPNYSQKDRVVALVNILQKDAPLLYYHKSDHGRLETYTLTKRALMADLKWMADGKLPHDSTFICSEEMLQTDNSQMTSKMLYAAYRQKQHRWIERLWTKFRQ